MPITCFGLCHAVAMFDFVAMILMILGEIGIFSHGLHLFPNHRNYDSSWMLLLVVCSWDIQRRPSDVAELTQRLELNGLQEYGWELHEATAYMFGG